MTTHMMTNDDMTFVRTIPPEISVGELASGLESGALRLSFIPIGQSGKAGHRSLRKRVSQCPFYTIFSDIRFSRYAQGTISVEGDYYI